MFYFDKHDPRVLFGDSRTFSGKLCDGRTFTVEPDEVMDFRNMPFRDESFQLVIFDPPHLRRVGDNSWMKAKYGQLPPAGRQGVQTNAERSEVMGKPKYRITTKFPCYDGVFPVTGYFVQRLEEGFFRDKWVDVKGFGSRKDAEELLKILEK